MRPDSREVTTRPGRDGRNRLQQDSQRNRTDRRRTTVQMLESLEPRTLLATAPTPEVVSPFADIVANSRGDQDTPILAASPNDPNRLVSVWTRSDDLITSDNQVLAEGAFSTDGGANWIRFTPSTRLADPNTTDPTVSYTGVTVFGLEFDRDDNFYVLSQQDDNVGLIDGAGSSAIVLNKFDFSGPTPIAIPTNPSGTGPTIIEQEVGTVLNRSLRYGLAVDTTLPVFTDPDTGVTLENPNSGNVYVALQTNDAPPALLTDTTFFNPHRIVVRASSDGGETFSGPIVLNDGGNSGTQRNNSFGGLTVSQGTLDNRVAPGQVTAIWSDEGTLANNDPPFTRIRSDRIIDGGVVESFSTSGGINDNGTTSFPIPVNITDTDFTTVGDIEVTLSLTHPNTDQLSITLVPPAGSGLPSIGLVNVGTLTGANLGIVNGFELGTTFDSEATLNILDPDGNGGNANANPFVGSFRPVSQIGGPGSNGGFNQYDGLTAGEIAGNWTLEINDNNDDNGPVQFLNDATLTIASGLSAGIDTTIATSAVFDTDPATFGGTFGTAKTGFSFVLPTGIGSDPVIAADNTIGILNPSQGRIYAAWVDFVDNDFLFGTPNSPDNTDIHFAYSEDGGLTWVNQFDSLNPLNDDRAEFDGFSEGFYSASPPIVDGRPQFNPDITVDQETGTVVVSYRDTRHDASRVRTSVAITTSIDGGETFSPSTFLNTQRTVVDAITGESIVAGPLPDNVSTGAGVPSDPVLLDTLFAPSIVATGGVIRGIWNGNENYGGVGNDGDEGFQLLEILGNTAVTAGGPRIIESTMGPIESGLETALSNGTLIPFNNLEETDGTPIFNGFTVTFDRPINASTFGLDDIQVFFRDTTELNTGGASIPVTEIVPLFDPDSSLTFGEQQTFGASRFLIRVAPTSSIGTYSYQINPEIEDQFGNLMDQNANAVLGEGAVDQVGIGDVYAVPNPVAEGPSFRITPVAGSVENFPAGFVLGPYDVGSLPIILNGPIVEEVTVPGENPGDVLAVDRKVDAIDLTFDRAMIAETFTPEDVIRIDGPSGPIAQKMINPDNSVTVPVEVHALFPSTDPAGTIPDNPNVSLVSNLVIPENLGDFTIADLDVRIDLLSPRSADLTIALIAPHSGLDPIVLANGVGGARGQDFQGTTFDDGGLLFGDPLGRSKQIPSINEGVSPFEGRFAPVDSLSVLNGLPLVASNTVGGRTWMLQVTDQNGNNLPEGEVQQLLDWSLAVRAEENPTSPNPALADHFRLTFYALAIDSETNAEVFVPDVQELSGTYSAVLSSEIVSSRGDLLDTDRDAGLDRLREFDPTVTTVVDTGSSTVLFDASLPGGLVIPDAIDANTPSVTTVPIVVRDEFFIEDLNVVVDLTHPDLGDVTLTLIAPDGTRVTLFNPDALNVPGANALNTVFDDQASTFIGDGGPPFFGSFRPVQPISGATTDEAGNPIQVNGTWMLEIVDAEPGPSTVGDAVLSRFALLFEKSMIGTVVAEADPLILPAAILDPIDLNTPTVTTIPLTVTENFLIGDLNLSVALTHPDVRNLTVALIGPDGSRSVLFSPDVFEFPGTGTSLEILFDDEAGSFIGSVGFDLLGRFRPQDQLSKTIVDIEGNPKRSAGVWQLEVTNPGPIGASIQSAVTEFTLTFQRPILGSGLGEEVADQATPSFRIFTMDREDSLSTTQWTAVGPAAIGADLSDADDDGIAELDGVTGAGRVTAIAVDPSDPSGNTVYVGGDGGGVWRTRNFLTTDPEGPTWIPLTDFGSNLSINIGTIAIVPRNDDPEQSIILAGTGNGSDLGSFDGLDQTSTGVGFLRSVDGGQTWDLLDSTVNVDPVTGEILPINSTLRDRNFVGDAIFKIVGDPTPTIDGGFTIFAAVTGANGGLYRSFNAGGVWEKISDDTIHGTEATDVILDPFSADSETGMLDRLYVGFRTSGIFLGTSQGDSLINQLTGGLGNSNRQDPITQVGIPVNNAGAPPIGGRYTLAMPAPTGIAAQDLSYADWLYAAGVDASGDAALFLTKDRGFNWTQIQLPLTAAGDNVLNLIPSNDVGLPDVYDDLSGNSLLTSTSAEENLVLAVDPSNPEIVYLGAEDLIRVDTTLVHDAHALINVDASSNNPSLEAGLNNTASSGAIFEDLSLVSTPFERLNPLSFFSPFTQDLRTFDFFIDSDGQVVNQAVNLARNPILPLAANATFTVNNITSFSNTGANATWTPAFDGALGDLVESDTTAPTQNFQVLLTMPDPVTGGTRLMTGTNHGIYTIAERDGTAIESIGNQVSPTGQRHGNLQIAQVHYGAVQPTDLAAQAASALFFATTNIVGFPASDPDILVNGQLARSDDEITNEFIIGAADGEAARGFGSGVATGQVDARSPLDPGLDQVGNAFEFKWPVAGGRLTDFLQLEGVVRPFGTELDLGRTVGLVRDINSGPLPDPQWPGVAPLVDTAIPFGNFAVNPINNDQLVISSAEGRLYRTVNQGRTWEIIGLPEVFGGTGFGSYAPALAFGAPDPGVQSPGSLDNFVYAGTVNGEVYVTFTGGGQAGQDWTNISAGLDGSSVLSIATNPQRGSFDAYAVTEEAVYYLPDASSPGASWINITGNLFSLTQQPFGNADLTEQAALNGELHSLAVDWRYLIPDANGTPRPVVYVSGFGGVFRSLDQGATWTSFPDNFSTGDPLDGTPGDDGHLPNVRVTDLDFGFGFIDPTNGRPISFDTTGADGIPGTVDDTVAVSPDVLLASTFGRGQFAIRIGPEVLETTVGLSSTLPDGPGGSDSGFDPNADGDDPTFNDLVTGVTTPVINGLGPISGFGSDVMVTLFDLTDPTDVRIIGGFNPDDPEASALAPSIRQIAQDAGRTDASGQFIHREAHLIGSTIPAEEPLAIPDDGVLEDSITVGSTVIGEDGFEITLPDNATVEDLDVIVSIDHSRVGDLRLTLVGPDGTEVPLAIQVGGVRDGFDMVAFDDSGALPINLDLPPSDNLEAPFAARFKPQGDLSAFRGRIAQGDWTLRVEDLATGETGTLNDWSLSLQTSSSRLLPGLRVAPGHFRTDGSTDGLITLGIQAVNEAGTLGNMVEFQFTLDTIPPDATPTVDLQASSDTDFPPFFSNDDNYTAVSTPTFDITGVEPNNILILFRDDAIANIVTADLVGGTVSVTDPGPNDDGVEDGTYIYSARQIDQAGNQSEVGGTVEVTIDTVPPAEPSSIGLLPSDDTGVPGDGITSVVSPTFIGFLGLAPEELIAENLPLIQLVSVSGEVLGQARVEPGGAYAVTVGDFDGDGNIDDPDQPILDDDTFQVQTRAVDRAGNTGEPSETFILTIDTSPAPEITLGLSPVDDTGILDDNITAVTNPRLIGMTAGGLPVQLIDLDGSLTGVEGGLVGDPVIAQLNGMFTLQFPENLDDDVYQLAAQVTTAAGAINLSAPLTLTIDTTPPDSDVDLALAPESDTGIIGDGITSIRRPFLIGNTDPNATVEIIGPDGAILASGPADDQGMFRLQLAQELVNGSISLRAQVVDPAGNVGAPSDPLLLQIVAVLGDFGTITGSADLALYRGDSPTSSFLISQNEIGAFSVPLGLPTDIPVVGDFDGDGVNDPTVFRPESTSIPGASEWIIQGSRIGLQTIMFGGAGLDLPAPADYTGDGITDIAVFRPESDLVPGAAQWFILPSEGGPAFDVLFGAANGFDVPAPADFDGDGRADIAVFRPDSDLIPGASQWFILPSGPNPNYETTFDGFSVLFGQAGVDLPVPLDYDGDGVAEIAAYRPTTSQWFFIPSASNPSGFDDSIDGGFAITFGAPGDVPAPADYTGDGLADLAAYRQSIGQWTIRPSEGGSDQILNFGGADVDVPVLSPLSFRDPRADSVLTPVSAAASSFVLENLALPASSSTNLDLEGLALANAIDGFGSSENSLGTSSAGNATDSGSSEAFAVTRAGQLRWAQEQSTLNNNGSSDLENADGDSVGGDQRTAGGLRGWFQNLLERQRRGIGNHRS